MHSLTPAFILRNLAQGQEHGRFAAVVLFVDTSGFTPLTTALMAHGTEGVEVIAQVLANLFAPLVEIIYHHGGFIAGFAGDAFKAIFPEMVEATYQRALTAAWQIRQHLIEQPMQPTRFGDFPFTIKVTVADGSVDWHIWQSRESGLAQQAATLFGGEALEQALGADALASAGEVILTLAVAARLPLGDVTLQAVGNHFRLCSWPDAAPIISLAVSTDVPLAASVAALATHFFPADLLERQTQGEFRQVVTVFVNLQRLPGHQETARFAATLFRLLAAYGGYLCRIGQIGDKDLGGTLLLFWGAPISHEQDVTSALHFVLALQNAAGSPLRVGVTTHLAYAGFVGSPRREEYTCYGSHVNQSARQMVRADWGEIWLDDETVRLAGSEFESTFHGAFRFKGFSEERAVYRLIGRREQRTENFYQGAMIGRYTEFAQLRAALAPLATGKFAGVISISGEAGIGKSRLVHEFQRQLENRQGDKETGSQGDAFRIPHSLLRTPQWFLCQTDEILRQPLNPFRYWLRGYFTQSTGQNEAANKVAFAAKLHDLLASLDANRAAVHAQSKIETLKSEIDRTRSFLAALVDLHWAASLYSQVEPQLRFENSLVALKTLILAESLRQPVILHVEDAHWLDHASRTFLTRLTQNVADYPLAIIITTRPVEETLSGQAGRPGDKETENLTLEGPQLIIRLATLTADEITALATAQLQGSPSPALVTLLLERAEGNPFFAEQLLRYLQEEALLTPGADGWQLATEQVVSAILPSGARALLVARLDRLPQPIKEVVQTAAVFGREFDLHVLVQMVADDPALVAKVAVADQAAIWSAMTETRYLFRHALLREAAYEMQLRARLRSLHRRAGAAIERVYRAELLPYVSELAYHYDQAEMSGVAAHWYGQAGEQASKQYANEAAARYFRRAVVITPASEVAKRYPLLLGSEAAHNWLGQRSHQQEDLAALEAMTELLNDAVKRSEVMLRKTAFHLATGHYQEAIHEAEQAVAVAVQAGDALAEARANHRWGRAFWQAGEYQRARPPLTLALVLARTHQEVTIEAQSLYDLAMIDYYQKAISSALAQVKQALLLFERVDDRRGIIYCLSLSAVILSNDGYYMEATAQFEEALQRCHHIGLRHAEAHLLAQSGDNELNLGALTSAYQRHTQALKLYQEMSNQEGIATSLDTIGLALAFLDRQEEAQTRYLEALAIHRAIYDQRGEGYVLTHLGYALLQRQEWQKAADVIEKALVLRRARQEEGLLIDTLAAYAATMSALDRPQAALAAINEILDWLASHDLTGVEFPGQVYLICYQVLHDLAKTQPIFQARARQALEAGYLFLQERANRIQDAGLRQSFLQNIPFHRELMALWHEHYSGKLQRIGGETNG